jgi:hypothetical protein
MFYLLGISNNCVPGHLARRDDRSHRSSRYACAYSLVATSATDRSPSGFIIGTSETNRLIEIFYRTLDVPSSGHHMDADDGRLTNVTGSIGRIHTCIAVTVASTVIDFFGAGKLASVHGDTASVAPTEPISQKSPRTSAFSS